MSNYAQMVYTARNTYLHNTVRNMSNQNIINSIPAPLPVDYDRQSSFTDYEIQNPGDPISGSQLDIEFNAVEAALDQTQARLRLIQRDDGALLNESVGLGQLKGEARIGVNAPTTWMEFTSYDTADTVITSGATWYVALVAHVSSDDFDADLAEGKWRVLIDLAPFTTEAMNWANLPEDQLVPEGDGVDDYSALHHAAKALASEIAALSSENAAAASATASQTSRLASETARDTTLGYRDTTLAARDTTLAARDTTLGYRDESLAARDRAELAAENADPIQYNTVASMAADNTLLVGSFVETRGYYARGDGGGNLYEIVAAGTGVADGGSYIDLTDSGLQAMALFNEGPVRVEQFGGEDAAHFAAAIASGMSLKLIYGKQYDLSSVITISTPTNINLNGATVAAQAGFTDDNLILIEVGGVTLYGGTLDGRNLPAISADYIGTVFTGITMYSPGTIGAVHENIALHDLTVFSGETGAISLVYCPRASVSDIKSYGDATVSEFAASATVSFNYCDRIVATNIYSDNNKWKGVEFRNSNDWSASGINTQTAASNQAALFIVGCNRFVVEGITAASGFGIKADSCLNGTISDFAVNCSEIGLGGVYLQGCAKVQLRSGVVRNFVDYGVAIGPHSTKLNNSIDCAVDGVIIHRDGTVDGDLSVGVLLPLDDNYGAYGTTLTNMLIRSVDIGVSSDGSNNALVDNIDINNVRFKDIKSFCFNGLSLSLNFSNNHIEGADTLTAVVYFWTGGAGSRLTVKGNEAFGIGAGARFIHLIGSASQPLSLQQLQVSNNLVTNGIRFLDIDLQGAASEIALLTVTDNQSIASASATQLSLDSASTVPTQVLILGNMFIASNKSTKQTINFIQTAASGQWNGVVENNMASVLNKPNNV